MLNRITGIGTNNYQQMTFKSNVEKPNFEYVDVFPKIKDITKELAEESGIVFVPQEEEKSSAKKLPELFEKLFFKIKKQPKIK